MNPITEAICFVSVAGGIVGTAVALVGVWHIGDWRSGNERQREAARRMENYERKR